MSTGKGLHRLGDVLPRRTATFINRTGATILLGELAMMDLAGTQAEVTTTAPGDAGSHYANLTPITQAGYDAGYPIVVCMEPAGVADNAKGEFLLEGVTDISILDDDITTTNVTEGGAVRVLVAEADSSGVTTEASTTPAALTVGGASAQGLALDTQRSIAIAVEVSATTGADTDRKIDFAAHRRKVWFFGGLPCCQQSA